MRDHDECERAYHAALAGDKPGRAEWVLTRCDREHGDIKAHAGPHAAAESTDTEETA